MLRRVLRTRRLHLVAVTPDLARAQLEGREALSRTLGAHIPDDWPPPLTEDTHEFIAERVGEHPDESVWWFWFWLRPDDSPLGRTAVAIGGFKGPPDATGTVEIGYSVVPGHQRQGLASEAVAELVRFAFYDGAVRRVIAETFEEHRPSIRVLERNGFRRSAEEASEPGAVRYERSRDE